MEHEKREIIPFSVRLETYQSALGELVDAVFTNVSSDPEVKKDIKLRSQAILERLKNSSQIDNVTAAVARITKKITDEVTLLKHTDAHHDPAIHSISEANYNLTALAVYAELDSIYKEYCNPEDQA